MFTYATQFQTVTQIWRDSFRLYGQTFAKVWYWAVIVPFVSELPKLANPLDEGASTQDEFSWTLGLVTLLAFIVSAFISGVIFSRMHNTAINPSAKLADSITLARKKWLVMLGAMLLSTIISGLGMLALIIPGILLTVLFILYAPFVLFEDCGVIDSLKGSAKLIWGNWWHTFLVIMMPLCCLLFLATIVTLMVGNDNPFASSLAQIVLITMITPLLDAVLLVQYHDLKYRRDADQKRA